MFTKREERDDKFSELCKAFLCMQLVWVLGVMKLNHLVCSTTIMFLFFSTTIMLFAFFGVIRLLFSSFILILLVMWSLVLLLIVLLRSDAIILMCLVGLHNGCRMFWSEKLSTVVNPGQTAGSHVWSDVLCVIRVLLGHRMQVHSISADR